MQTERFFFSLSFFFSVGGRRGCRLYTVMLHNFLNSIPSHTCLPLPSMLTKYIIHHKIVKKTTKRHFFLDKQIPKLFINSLYMLHLRMDSLYIVVLLHLNNIPFISSYWKGDY